MCKHQRGMNSPNILRKYEKQLGKRLRKNSKSAFYRCGDQGDVKALKERRYYISKCIQGKGSRFKKKIPHKGKTVHFGIVYQVLEKYNVEIFDVLEKRRFFVNMERSIVNVFQSGTSQNLSTKYIHTFMDSTFLVQKYEKWVRNLYCQFLL